MNERLNIECVKVIIGDLCRYVCIYVSTYVVEWNRGEGGTHGGC